MTDINELNKEELKKTLKGLLLNNEIELKKVSKNYDTGLEEYIVIKIDDEEVYRIFI